jgi:hypothetical protein
MCAARHGRWPDDASQYDEEDGDDRNGEGVQGQGADGGAGVGVGVGVGVSVSEVEEAGIFPREEWGLHAARIISPPRLSASSKPV